MFGALADAGRVDEHPEQRDAGGGADQEQQARQVRAGAVLDGVPEAVHVPEGQRAAEERARPADQGDGADVAVHQQVPQDVPDGNQRGEQVRADVAGGAAPEDLLGDADAATQDVRAEDQDRDNKREHEVPDGLGHAGAFGGRGGGGGGHARHSRAFPREEQPGAGGGPDGRSGTLGAMRVLEVFTVFLRLGLSSFGGPVAHLGFFRAEFVGRRAWLSDAEYAELVAVANFLPGPSSSQVGLAVGLRRAGWAGAGAAWLGFTLPSALIMALLGFTLAGGAADGAGWVQGVKLAAAAVVAQAVAGMWGALVTDRVRVGLALGAAAALLHIKVEMVFVRLVGVRPQHRAEALAGVLMHLDHELAVAAGPGGGAGRPGFGRRLGRRELRRGGGKHKRIALRVGRRRDERIALRHSGRGAWRLDRRGR